MNATRVPGTRARRQADQAAAAALVGALDIGMRPVVLRILWRMVRRRKRASAALTIARSYAPKGLLGIRAAGGAR